MLIDWFTVAAQAINFLILVWLLKRFLYKPVLTAIEERRKRIAETMEQARRTGADAEAAKSDYARRSSELQSTRDDLLSRATADAAAERKRLVEEAQAEAEELRRSWRAAVQSERDETIAELGDLTRREVFSITRKALADLAGADLEERMISSFVDRLRAVGDDQRALLTAPPAEKIAVVRSAFELSDSERATLTQAAREILGPGTSVRFETASGLVAGISLSAGGYSVAWSIASYLKDLEAGVGAILSDSSPRSSVEQPAAPSAPGTGDGGRG